MDSGGLAHMAYNPNLSSAAATPTAADFSMAGHGIGLPAAGFAARRANGGHTGSAHVKRLSFAPRPAAHESPLDSGAPTPRTSRSHLLAGLRTAPKSAIATAGPGYPSMPSTAPATQQHFPGAGLGLAASMYAQEDPMPPLPQRAGSLAQPAGYPGAMYPMTTDQILSPPELRVDEQAQEQMDPNLYAQLVATNLYLAEQQKRLQQQLMSVQAAAQQMQGLNMNSHMMSPSAASQQHPALSQHFVAQTPPVTPHNMGLFQQQQQQQQQLYQHQQVKNHMQPVVTPVPGAQPGLYSYYNPLTGQHSYFVDQGQGAVDLSGLPGRASNYSPPQQPGTPRFQVSPPPNEDVFRSISPPKQTAGDVTPLPPPSAGAFRRGHRKADSMALDKVLTSDSPRMMATAGGPKTPGILSAAGTPTPTTTGFGPGQARAGDHPMRQPRGPPPIDELKAKPTTHYEGSKNFAARTRRSAVHNLVRAGLERRRAEGSRFGSASPVSETGAEAFRALCSASPSEDDGSDSGRSGSGSGSLSWHPSIGSSRTSAHGAIGSDRPSRANSFEHPKTVTATLTAAAVDAAPGAAASMGLETEETKTRAGSFAAVFKNAGKKPEEVTEKKKAPMLVLTSAEKRKTSMV